MPDAPMIDADPGPVCGNSMVEMGEDCDDGNKDDGDGCSATCQDEITFFSDEGGEVRFEYIRFPDADLDQDPNTPLQEVTRTRVISYFASDDDQDFHDYPVDFVTPGTCYKVVDDTKWPTNQPANRKNVDVGNLIISAAQSNTAQALNVPKAQVAKDPLQRDHGVGNWYYHYQPAGTPGASIGDTAMYTTAKTSYDVTFTGSDTWPAQVFPDAIYLPSDFSLKDANGDLNADEVNEPVVLAANTAYTFKWQNKTEAPSGHPAGVTDQWTLVGFIAGGTTHGGKGAVVVCVNIDNTGEQVVPADLVDYIRSEAPDGGTVIRQVFHHNVRELTNGTTVKNRRIDMIGVWCYARSFGIN